MYTAFPKPEAKPSLGQGLGLHSMRKAASCEPLSMEKLALSDDEGYRGGARCETASDFGSPSPKTLFEIKMPTSDDGNRVPSRVSTFLVEPRDDDDVFIEGSNDAFHGTPSLRDAKEVAVYQDADDRTDPQTMYAGSSCMFVANLPQHFGDRKLEEEVTKAFSQFGIVFVKIKRDGRGMPFAFCQYTNDVDAQNAMKMGKGTIILERPCRTEMARANTSFVVYKMSRQRIRPSEARDLLRRLGEVAKTEYLKEGLRVMAGLPQAIIVTYKMYDPRRDPVRTFANDPTFCVKVYDPKALSGPGSTPNTNPRETGFLKQYDRDRRSAYVGNLPPSITRDVLQSLASSCGEVLDLQLHMKDVPGGNGLKTCFAFLEFNRPDAPEDLIEALHNTDIDGYRIRAERKQSRPSETPRRTLPQTGLASHERYPVRRPRVDSFELEKPSEGRFGISPESMGRQTRGAPYVSNSFTPGRSRYPRPSILDSGASLAAGIFEPVTPAFKLSPCGSAGPSRTVSAAAVGPSAKKSVGFDLSHCSESCSSTNSESGCDDADKVFKPITPKAADTTATSSAKKASASRKMEGPPVPPTAMPWMSSYPHFGYPYMGAPMTPQTNPGFMYPGYMQSPMYHPMYDMYGNMMISPTHMMPPFGGHLLSNETPVHSDQGDKASDGSCEENADTHNKGKGRGE